MIKDNGVIFRNRFRENNCQLRILHLAKLSHSREGKMTTFQANNERTAHKNPHGKKVKQPIIQEGGNVTQKGILCKKQQQRACLVCLRL